MPASAPGAVRWKRTPAHTGSSTRRWGLPCWRSGSVLAAAIIGGHARSPWRSRECSLTYATAVIAMAYEAAGVRAAKNVTTARSLVGTT
ncbi:hypothetical protein [Streptomyces sp. NBC_01750]|uniref:hypothetical protein n=1 Tax=Streptomyces sp. NBC_01750 TaxID=2975928 RepID=UPI002DDC4DB2|nr:hypothetical protein [Streptomyces sp. NBC_01750]WSD30629.1 hypothetical protein OG966_00705 [Streptomyces sp. NBC_01750]